MGVSQLIQSWKNPVLETTKVTIFSNNFLVCASILLLRHPWIWHGGHFCWKIRFLIRWDPLTHFRRESASRKCLGESPHPNLDEKLRGKSLRKTRQSKITPNPRKTQTGNLYCSWKYHVIFISMYVFFQYQACLTQFPFTKHPNTWDSVRCSADQTSWPSERQCTGSFLMTGWRTPPNGQW